MGTMPAFTSRVEEIAKYGQKNALKYNKHLLQSPISCWPSTAKRPSSASSQVQANATKMEMYKKKPKQNGEIKVAKYYQDLKVFALLTENFDEGINISYTQEICRKQQPVLGLTSTVCLNQI